MALIRSKRPFLCAVLIMFASGHALAAGDWLSEDEQSLASAWEIGDALYVPSDSAAARETDVEPALIHAVIAAESGYNPAAHPAVPRHGGVRSQGHGVLPDVSRRPARGAMIVSLSIHRLA